MTTNAPTAESQDAGDAQPTRRSWDETAFLLAGRLSRADFARGDLAELRRMNPDSPDAAAYWRLMAQYGLLDSGRTVELKWALIIHGIALMTPTGAPEGSRSAHDGYTPVGRALYQGGNKDRTGSGFYSELRLNRLLNARGQMLRSLLGRMFRMLASADVSFNWREMARFIRDDGYNDAAAEESRRRIAREYFQAERSSSQQSQQT